MEIIKRQINYLISSIFQIIQGALLFALVFSGLVCALFLRHFGYNGLVITAGGILVELISLIICYFIFKSYLKTEEVKPVESKSKKGEK